MLDPVHPFDIGRLLLGNQPPLYLLEVFARTLVVYLYAFGLMRWLGSRTVGQLSTIEFLLVIALGSAVGDPMFYPNVPLLPALATVTMIVLINKGLDYLVARNTKVEHFVDGQPIELIEHGVLLNPLPGEASIGRNEVFQQLRQNGIRHLGEVEAAYLEPNGQITVFRADRPVPGLKIVPPRNLGPAEEVELSATDDATSVVCARCGATPGEAARASGRCARCGGERWTRSARA